MADDPPAAALDADYSDLVSKQLIPDGAEITGIIFKDFSLSHAADDNAWILKPENPKIGSDQKQRLADNWKSARAMWNAADLPEGSKGEEVTVQLKDRALKFIVAEREPQLLSKGSPASARLSVRASPGVNSCAVGQLRLAGSALAGSSATSSCTGAPAVDQRYTG